MTSLNIHEVFFQWYGVTASALLSRVLRHILEALCQLDQMLPRKWTNSFCFRRALPAFWTELFPGLHSYRSNTTHFSDSWHIPLHKGLTSVLYQHKPAQQNLTQQVPDQFSNAVTPRYMWMVLTSINRIVPYSGWCNMSRYLGCITLLQSLQKGRNPAWT